MNVLNLTREEALISWDCLDLVVRSGGIKNPEQLEHVGTLRKKLANLADVKKALAEKAKAVKP